MNMWLTYIIITVLLFAAELVYFRVADHFNIPGLGDEIRRSVPANDEGR